MQTGSVFELHIPEGIQGRLGHQRKYLMGEDDVENANADAMCE